MYQEKMYEEKSYIKYLSKVPVLDHELSLQQKGKT